MKDRPLWLMTKGRMTEFVREPSALFWTFGFPLLLTVALGLAFRPGTVPKSRIAVIDNGAGNDVMRSLADDDQVAPELHLGSEAQELLAHGKIVLVIDKTKEGEVVFRFDPSRPDARNLRLSVEDALQRAAGRTSALAIRDELVRAPGSRYVDWLVPGLIGMQLMSGSLYGVGWALVQNRQRKLLKRLLATPMRRRDYLLSYMFSRLVGIFWEVGALCLFAALAFGVSVHGSWVTLAIVSTAGAVSFAGLALLCASRAQNSESVGGLMNLAMFPMFILSGVFFSSANFPQWAQPAIKVLPLSALNDALRAVINDGARLVDLGPEFAILAVWGGVTFVIALRIFRWT